MAAKKNPDEVVHLQVAEGSTVVYKNISYGLRCKSGVVTSLESVVSTRRSILPTSPTLRRGCRP